MILFLRYFAHIMKSEEHIYDVHGEQYPKCTKLTVDRVRNPKNQLSQINPFTTMGCSLEYPIAKSTMKLEARLLSSQNYALLLFVRDAQFLFKISCSTQKTEWNLLLSQTLSRVIVGKKDPQW